MKTMATHASDSGANNPSIDRRTLLRHALWMAAAAGLPFSSKLAAEDVSPVMAQLSTYMSEAFRRPLPDKALDDAKHHVLDTVAAMISGSELPSGRQAMQF